MPAGEPKTVAIAAIAGNTAIAATKFVAAAFTGSAALLSEGIHSAVDTTDGLLLLWGLRQSARPPDETHPFGHAKELYFWTLIVAVMIFAVGGGISALEGVYHIFQPEPIEHPLANYIVIGLAMLFEGLTWTKAFKEFRKQKTRRGYWHSIRASKDPSVFTVLFEDTAALLGLVVALIGVTLAQWLDQPMLDGVASVVIGVIMAGVALALARESKDLLIGEAVDRKTREEIHQIVEADPDIDRLVRSLSMHLGPEDVLLTLELAFRPSLTAADTSGVIDRLASKIRDDHPEIKHLFIEAQSLAGVH